MSSHYPAGREWIVPRASIMVARSCRIIGMAAVAGLYRRPLLGIRRTTTVQACADAGLEPWLDPRNDDAAFARVRVRQTLLPALEAGLGPGIHEALARTAEQLAYPSDINCSAVIERKSRAARELWPSGR